MKAPSVPEKIRFIRGYMLGWRWRKLRQVMRYSYNSLGKDPGRGNVGQAAKQRLTEAILHPLKLENSLDAHNGVADGTLRMY
jgi:hypothetical protein